MAFEIGPKTKIDDLLREHPYLLDVLIAQAPAFSKLKNPVLRKMMGKVATLEKAAGVGGLDVGVLVATVQKAVAAHGGEADERKAAIKAILKELHQGASPEDMKDRFRQVLGGVGPSEVAAVEQSLIDEGLPAEEIKNLCDVHVEIFKEALEERDRPEPPPGHPVHTYMKENRELEVVASRVSLALGRFGRSGGADGEEMGVLIDELARIDIHYTRKENQLFPMLEAHHFTGPSQVMWSIHDDIRAGLETARASLADRDAEALRTTLLDTLKAARDMIYKEEHILFPASLDMLTRDEWIEMARGEADIGFAWTAPDAGWPGEGASVPEGEGVVTELPEVEGAVTLSTGRLTPAQINLLLTHLPVDVTYVDANDRVAYYSEGPERIFPRSPAIIGREVRYCHPPKSVHVVNTILDGFKAGERDTAEFWLELGGKFIHIRYFAIRDGKGAYQGTLEVSQDITTQRALEGSRRLLDWE